MIWRSCRDSARPGHQVLALRATSTGRARRRPWLDDLDQDLDPHVLALRDRRWKLEPSAARRGRVSSARWCAEDEPNPGNGSCTSQACKTERTGQIDVLAKPMQLHVLAAGGHAELGGVVGGAGAAELALQSR